MKIRNYENLNKEENINLNKELEKYLSQVDRYLKYMPISEKTDILSDCGYIRLKWMDSS